MSWVNVRRTIGFATVIAGALVLAFACGQTANPGGCQTNQKSCNGTCVATDTDPQNCGACGMACDPTSVCSKGSCVSLCATGAQACATGDGGALCIDIQSDNKNCGACGSPCKPLEACALGKCQGGCPQGEQGCIPEAGAAFCANVASDNQNCGACFNTCGTLQVCASGACSNECVAGQTACNGSGDASSPYCANLQTDNANCGMCGVPCGLLEVCAGGKCSSACLSTQTLCVDDAGVLDAGGYCADLKSDNYNCGSCGYVCPFGTPLCSAGSCISPG